MHAGCSRHVACLSPGEIALLAADLYDEGYRVVGAHANPGCASCFEYSLVRFTCPRKFDPRTATPRSDHDRRRNRKGGA